MDERQDEGASALALLTEHGGAAEIHVATDVHVLVEGREVDGLPDVFLRRLLENAALVEVAASGGIVNAHDRDVRRQVSQALDEQRLGFAVHWADQLAGRLRLALHAAAERRDGTCAATCLVRSATRARSTKIDINRR